SVGGTGSQRLRARRELRGTRDGAPRRAGDEARPPRSTDRAASARSTARCVANARREDRRAHGGAFVRAGRGPFWIELRGTVRKLSRLGERDRLCHRRELMLGRALVNASVALYGNA